VIINKNKNASRKKRHMRVRTKITGTAQKPRLNVYRSLNHIYAQIIDDVSQQTLVAASSNEPAFRELGKSGGNVEGARIVGQMIAERALAKDIEKVVLDRGGHKYHGRVRALAEGAREGGLDF